MIRTAGIIAVLLTVTFISGCSGRLTKKTSIRNVQATTNLETRHFDLKVRLDYLNDGGGAGLLSNYMDFADRCYEDLSGILGYAPNNGSNIILVINKNDGNPYFNGNVRPPVVNLPWNIIARLSDRGISRYIREWGMIVFPHELAHYFLLTQFPGPPRWFVEGPASYFANRVTYRLGMKESTDDDKNKIEGWGRKYAALKCDYVFTPFWPNDNPGDHPLGFGYAYLLMDEMAARFGDDCFKKCFRYMLSNHIVFTSGSKDGATRRSGAVEMAAGTNPDHDRTAVIISALSESTGGDFGAFFLEKGFTNR